MKNIVICGFSGKTGSVLMNYLLGKKDINIVGLVNQSSISLEDTLKFTKSDIVIDFTTPRTGYLDGLVALKYNNHYICGTTGLLDEQIRHIDMVAKEKELSVMICPNFAKGINALLKAIPLFDSIYENSYICEHHHVTKLDKPSGTAIKLSKKFKNKGIEIVSYRTISPIIFHTITFSSEYETVTITHQVNNKMAFCDGVYDTILKVGSWIGVRNEL